jgi:molybdopterin-guanine dinucleotide biosynthesis protein A
MGGVAKGNLLYLGRTLLDRTLDACRRAFPEQPDVCLVGESGAYCVDGVRRLLDDPAGVGPMGGLRALLLAAKSGQRPAIAVANDLPFLTPALLRRVALEAPGEAALAPLDEGRWQPLFARYAPERVLPIVDALLAAGETSLQGIFERLGRAASVLQLSPSELATLKDWDRPSDMISGCPKSAG